MPNLLIVTYIRTDLSSIPPVKFQHPSDSLTVLTAKSPESWRIQIIRDFEVVLCRVVNLG